MLRSIRLSVCLSAPGRLDCGYRKTLNLMLEVEPNGQPTGNGRNRNGTSVESFVRWLHRRYVSPKCRGRGRHIVSPRDT